MTLPEDWKAKTVKYLQEHGSEADLQLLDRTLAAQCDLADNRPVESRMLSSVIDCLLKEFLVLKYLESINNCPVKL